MENLTFDDDAMTHADAHVILTARKKEITRNMSETNQALALELEPELELEPGPEPEPVPEPEPEPEPELVVPSFEYTCVVVPHAEFGLGMTFEARGTDAVVTGG